MDIMPADDVDGTSPLNGLDTAALEAEPKLEIPLLTPPDSLQSLQETDAEDYSDAPLVDSPRQQQRRHPRGGRKLRQPRIHSQRLQSVSEIKPPTSLRCKAQQEPEESETDEEYFTDAPTSPLLAGPDDRHTFDDYDDDALNKARESRLKEKRHMHPRTQADSSKSTGVSSFRIERPRGGGRKPPISVSVERPNGKTKFGSRSEGGNRRRRNDEQKSGSEENTDGDDAKDSAHEEQRKPVQIRLDINLELEILFKAKIKGDVTITFLE